MMKDNAAHSTDHIEHTVRKCSGRSKTEWQKNAIRVCGQWSEQLSSKGKVYFYNCVTEVSQWQKPAEWTLPDMHKKDLVKILNDRKDSEVGIGAKRLHPMGLQSHVKGACVDQHSTSPKRSRYCEDLPVGRTTPQVAATLPRQLQTNFSTSDPPRQQAFSRHLDDKRQSKRAEGTVRSSHVLPLRLEQITAMATRGIGNNDDMDISPNSSPLSAGSSPVNKSSCCSPQRCDRRSSFTCNPSSRIKDAQGTELRWKNKVGIGGSSSSLRQLVDAIRESLGTAVTQSPASINGPSLPTKAVYQTSTHSNGLHPVSSTRERLVGSPCWNAKSDTSTTDRSPQWLVSDGLSAHTKLPKSVDEVDQPHRQSVQSTPHDLTQSSSSTPNGSQSKNTSTLVSTVSALLNLLGSVTGTAHSPYGNASQQNNRAGHVKTLCRDRQAVHPSRSPLEQNSVAPSSYRAGVGTLTSRSSVQPTASHLPSRQVDDLINSLESFTHPSARRLGDSTSHTSLISPPHTNHNQDMYVQNSMEPRTKFNTNACSTYRDHRLRHQAVVDSPASLVAGQPSERPLDQGKTPTQNSQLNELVQVLQNALRQHGSHDTGEYPPHNQCSQKHQEDMQYLSSVIQQKLDKLKAPEPANLLAASLHPERIIQQPEISPEFSRSGSGCPSFHGSLNHHFETKRFTQSPGGYRQDSPASLSATTTPSGGAATCSVDLPPNSSSTAPVTASSGSTSSGISNGSFTSAVSEAHMLSAAAEAIDKLCEESHPTFRLDSPSVQIHVDAHLIMKFKDESVERLEKEARVESRNFDRLHSVLFSELSAELKKLRALVRISEAKLTIHHKKQASLLELMDTVVARKPLPHLSFADDVL